MALGFQTQVYPQQAPGVEGDFCDHTPRTTVDAGPGGLVAGAPAITVARFGWLEYSRIDPNNAPCIVRTRSTGGAPAGFIHREQQGLITDYLGGSSMDVPGGFPITLHNQGGFFVLNRGANYAQIGMKAFARVSDGGVMFGPTGSAAAGGLFNAAITGAIVASTFAVEGAIDGNQLTVTAVTAGVVVPGATIAGAGIPPGCRITDQIGGINGGIGLYTVSFGELNIPPATPANVFNGTYGTLNVTAVASGQVSVGAMLTGGTIAAPTTVTAMGPNWGLTGTGNVGTYAVDQNVAATAAAASSAWETKWFATSAAMPGGIIKMSSWSLG